MNALEENMTLALIDINHWKIKYIKKQLKKYPNISKEELTKKIKNAKVSYFKRHHKEFYEALFKDILDFHKCKDRSSKSELDDKEAKEE